MLAWSLFSRSSSSSFVQKKVPQIFFSKFVSVAVQKQLYCCPGVVRGAIRSGNRGAWQRNGQQQKPQIVKVDWLTVIFLLFQYKLKLSNKISREVEPAKKNVVLHNGLTQHMYEWMAFELLWLLLLYCWYHYIIIWWSVYFFRALLNLVSATKMHLLQCSSENKRWHGVKCWEGNMRSYARWSKGLSFLFEISKEN